MKPRTVASWDDYFYGMLLYVASRSKDPSTQVGSLLVRDRTIIATGYNGFPRGVADGVHSRWDRPEKYFWSEHSERNAIFNAAREGAATKGTALYTMWLPCHECARAIVQAGIDIVMMPSAVHDYPWRDEEHDPGSVIIGPSGKRSLLIMAEAKVGIIHLRNKLYQVTGGYK